MVPHDNFETFFNKFDFLSSSYWPYVIAAIVCVLSIVKAYMEGAKCPVEDRIDGKIVVITGASSGIGKEIALELARRGGRIIAAVKNEVAGSKLIKEISLIPGAVAEVRKINLASLKNVRDFVKKLEIDKIDILINNAGIVFHPFEKTSEGFEKHFVTNYLGHFLLTQLLLPKLMNSKQGRIINISSEAHLSSNIHLDDLNLEKNYTAREAFGQSKLALILMTRYMSELLKDTCITINAVNPGIVRGTQHMRFSPFNSAYVLKLIMLPWMWLLLKNPKQGAQTTIYLSVANSLSGVSGKYFSECQLKIPAPIVNDMEIAAKLYLKSKELLQPYLYF